MNSSKGETAGERGQEKVSTKSRIRKRVGLFLLPILTAAPIIAGMLFAVYRFGPTVRKLLNVMIKLVVTT